MTVKEIARLAGVSIGTVDRVLHERGRVSPETRDRIRSIVEQSGYQPNLLARQLKRGMERNFRVFMPQQDDEPYWDLAREGVDLALRDLAGFGIRVEACSFNRYRPATLSRALAKASREGCDGIVLAPAGITRDDLPPRLPPLAFFDATMDGFEPSFSIGQDPWKAGWLAGRMMDLLVPGRGELAVVNSHPEDPHLNRRSEGFAAWFKEHPGAPFVIREYRAPRTANGPDLAFLCHRIRAESAIPAGIYVCNAGVSAVVEGLGLPVLRAKRPGVVGHDLVEANRALLASGAIDCLISQDPARQVARALQVLHRAVAMGLECPPAESVPMEVWFPENLPSSTGEA